MHSWHLEVCLLRPLSSRLLLFGGCREGAHDGEFGTGFSNANYWYKATGPHKVIRSLTVYRLLHIAWLQCHHFQTVLRLHAELQRLCAPAGLQGCAGHACAV